MESYFTKDPNLLYFNSANLSICPDSVINAIVNYRLEFEQNPTEGLKTSWAKLWEVQASLALFLGADPKDLFLKTNMTEALNAFILGYPLIRGDEILVGELEYGAIANICRYRAERDFLKLRVLQLPQSQIALSTLTQEKLEQEILSQISSKTKMIVLSHVIASTGLKIPIEKIAAVTRKHKIALIIDGAYVAGAIALNFKELGDIDFYACSLYKWLLGPKGTAFGWVNPIHQETLIPLQAGWTTFNSSGSLAEFGEGSRFQQKFQPLGCRDVSPFFAIKELLAFWNTLGIHNIQKRMAALNSFFQQEMKRGLGWSSLLADDPKLQGPMSIFRIPDKLQPRGPELETLMLSQLNIQLHFTVLKSGWYAVFSPHIYNNEQEITLVINRIKKYLYS